MSKVLAVRGAPEHAAEASLAEGVTTWQQTRHNPLAAPHRQSDSEPSRRRAARSKNSDLDLALLISQTVRPQEAIQK